MAVAAMGAGDVVIASQRRADANRDGFFAAIEMGKARHARGFVEVVDLFFEEANLRHLVIACQPSRGIAALIHR